MRNKYKPLSYAVRAQQLLPYISFNKEGETTCRGKVYSCRWSIEAAKDPKCKDNLKEDGWSLLNKNRQFNVSELSDNVFLLKKIRV